MYLGGVIALVVILLSILILLGVVGLSAQVVGGVFLALAVGLLGPFVDKWGRPV